MKDEIRQRIVTLLRWMVIAASVVLVLVISWDTLNNMSFAANPLYEKLQFWICILFLFDIAVEWALARHRWRYLASNVGYILVSIPYFALIKHFGWQLPEPVAFVLRFLPLVRAAFVLGLLVQAAQRNRIKSMFASYMTLLLVTLYFGSLMFYIEEQPVNPGVTDYWSALWWAIMDMTTCGSSIDALTPTGEVLGVVLAAEGLILFPVFTVYITNALQGNVAQAGEKS